MGVNIELPQPIEDKLRNDLGDLGAVGKEAMLVELYRLGKLTHHELSEALSLGRLEVDGVLKRHNVTEDLPTPDELEEQLATARTVPRS
jgi:hypothetical protein